MDKNVLFINNIKNLEDFYDNNSTNMQMFQDSLENSVNLISLNDSLNTNNNYTQHLTTQQVYTKPNPNKYDTQLEDDSIDEIEELSTQEKMRFSTNLNNLKKSVALKTSENQSELMNSMDYSFFKDEETAKISYKFISKYDREIAEQKINNLANIKINNQIKENSTIPSNEEDNKFFWFAAYDKLIHTKNIKKIFNFFSDFVESNSTNGNINNRMIKEQAIIMKDFELFFDLNSPRGFIRQKKDSFSFLKLYFISVKSFNLIFNYINKTEQKLKIEDFLFTNNSGDSLKYNSNLDKKTNLPYSNLICLGSFLNTNIYSFTTLNNNNLNNITSPKNVNNFTPVSNKSIGNENIRPKIKLIVKMIKYLSETFSNYSEEFFMYHLYSRNGINPNQNNKLNYSAHSNGNIQIQLTEIKSLLNKKKLKNLDLKNSQILNNTSGTTNNNVKISNITSNKNMSTNVGNSFRSFNTNNKKINHNYSKTISINKFSFNKFNKNKYQNSINTEPKFKLNDILLNDSDDMNEICNHKTPKAKDNLKIFSKINQHHTNSKIFVVNRDSNIRLKTEFKDEDDSDDSDFDIGKKNNINGQEKINYNKNSNKKEGFNTPTKKRIFRYYS